MSFIKYGFRQRLLYICVVTQSKRINEKQSVDNTLLLDMECFME